MSFASLSSSGCTAFCVLLSTHVNISQHALGQRSASAREAREILEWMNCLDLNVLRVRILQKLWNDLQSLISKRVEAQNTVVNRISPRPLGSLANGRFSKTDAVAVTGLPSGPWVVLLWSQGVKVQRVASAVTMTVDQSVGGDVPDAIHGLWCDTEVFCMSIIGAGRVHASPGVRSFSRATEWSMKSQNHHPTPNLLVLAWNWCLHGLIKYLWRWDIFRWASPAALTGKKLNLQTIWPGWSL